MRMIRAWGAAALLAAVAALAVGCRGPEFGEVEGRVTLDGAPLPEVEVTFIPDPSTGTSGNNASAMTDADGRYRLRSVRDSRDGVVLGTHRVVVLDLLAVADLTTAGLPPPGEGAAQPKSAGPKPRRFPAAYGDPAKTPLNQVAVKAGKQVLDFDLKSRGR